MDLSHVLWIGGGRGSGKSSVARALSRRFDLQLYAVDQRALVHEPRMPQTDSRSLSLDERWVEATPAEVLDRFLTISRHRFRLVLEDLAALPPSPLAIVEGVQLFPTSVAAVLREPDHALFLIPDLEEQRARANATECDLMITRRVRGEAADLRLAALPVDAPLDEMIERAAEHFRPVIERYEAVNAAEDRSP